ncbi:3054_t:CDS:10, partial [Funneliformis geosporum]
MKNFSGINSLYFITIFILFIDPLSISSYKVLSYNETEPDYKINQILTYPDGISVVFLTKPINDTCNEPRIDLRVIHPNGTVDKVKVEHSIPDFNFCLVSNDKSLRITLIRNIPDSIYALYVNSSDINSASYYVSLLTHTGKIISNTFLSRVPVMDGILSSSGFMYSHDNEAGGFIFWNYLTEAFVKWIYFSKPDSDGNFHPINNGHLEIKNPSLDTFNIFATIDETFAIVSSRTNISNQPFDVSMDPVRPTFGLYVTFINPDKTVDGPFLLYQSVIPNLQIMFRCSKTYTTLGNSCILNMKRDEDYKLIQIKFQNTGSVVGINKFSSLELYKDLRETTEIRNLFYGGFLVQFFDDSDDTLHKPFQSIILDDERNYYSTLEFPKDLKFSNNCAMGEFRYNTFVVAYQDDEYTWKVYSEDLPRFFDDNGYNNINVNTTHPLINSKIPLSTTSINITYNFPIIMSTNNISIYQDGNGKNAILRQSIPGNSPSSFVYSADNQSLILNVLESTFNQPNANYYIVIDDNAVKDLKTDQPLMGIQTHTWMFNTNVFAEDAIGRFALTTEGTNYFENLPPYNKTTYLLQLRIDLSNLIPVDINRLDAIICCEYDRSQQLPKILLSLPIKSTTKSNDRNVDRVIKDLDLLIKNKKVTPISWFFTTNYIDASFGFQLTVNLFQDFKFHLIGIAIGIIILGLLYFYARKRSPTGKNIAIFKFSLIILDFILDFLFVLNNGAKVPQLFIPSITFCAMPLAINFIMSIVMILREIKHNKGFYEWFKENTNMASLFTILASTDIGVLNILSSNVAGMALFNAPISNGTQSLIFLGGHIGFVIEDIPQFIIQVLYKNSTITYDIIPFLTLLTSSIVLVTSIVSRVYHLIVYSCKKPISDERLFPINQNMSSAKVDVVEIEVKDHLTVPQVAKKKFRKSVDEELQRPSTLAIEVILCI